VMMNRQTPYMTNWLRTSVFSFPSKKQPTEEPDHLEVKSSSKRLSGQ
jgi:hypothetical protein